MRTLILVKILSDLPTYENSGGKCKVVRGRRRSEYVQCGPIRLSKEIHLFLHIRHETQWSTLAVPRSLARSLPTQTRLYRPRFQRRRPNGWTDGRTDGQERGRRKCCDAISNLGLKEVGSSERCGRFRIKKPLSVRYSCK